MSTTDKLAGAIIKKPTASVASKRMTSKTPIINMLLDPKFKRQMAMALPKSLTADRLTRIVMTEFRKTPELINCNQDSLLGAIMQCAALGLEPGSALGHCYLIPYNKQCQLIIGYRGMIDLARRSGQIVSLSAYCVHEADDFHYELGLHPDIHHIPSASAANSPVTFVYAVAVLKDGGVQFEVMSRAEIEKVRNSSKAGKSGPWASHWDEMAKKGLALDTRIPTPDGWTTMEALQKGDRVFDKDGKVTTVTAISEVKHLPCFRVTFSNGSSVVCDDEHRWLARKGGSNAWKQSYREMTVNEMYEAKEDGLSVTIPVQGALALPEANLPLDPYILGYWLGDGSARGAQITCSKEDLPHVMEAIKAAGFSVGTIRSDGRSEAVTVGATDGMRTKLLGMNLILNKHIPDAYMRSSIEQRKALLAGLLDSDGHCDKERGRASFCSSDRKLRDSVFELACSLGECPHKRDFMAVVYEHGFPKKFPTYQVEWKPSFNPFHLARKAANYQDRKINPYLGIKSIEKIESVPTKCIAVDSPSRTYLCGDNMAVTHNTVIRRLFKYLPVSIEATRAVEVDEKADRGEGLTEQDWLDAEYIDKGTAAAPVIEEAPAAPEPAPDPQPLPEPAPAPQPEPAPAPAPEPAEAAQAAGD